MNADLSNKLVRLLVENGEIQTISFTFNEIPTTVGKVDFLIELLEENNLLPKFLPDLKSNTVSSELRKRGNEFFKRGANEKALEFYTYSIAAGEKSSEELSLGYANRSAVLFRLQLFDDALKDIKRALDNNYPERLKGKLLERKDRSENLLPKQKKITFHGPIPFIPDEQRNESIECASNAVEIKSDEKLGRHIIAARDLEIGDVVAVEKPAFTVLTDRKWCFCHHCLSLCYSLEPCPTCKEALFCSPTCMDAAQNYHQFECPILATLDSLDMNKCRLIPLRIAVIMRDFNYKSASLKTGNYYKSGRYKEVHNLVTNQESRTVSCLFERIAVAGIFYDLLSKNTEFFKGNEERINNFKCLVVHHLQAMACNFHGIDVLEKVPVGYYEPHTIASGAYAFMSLFNHACNPNIVRAAYGTTMVCVVTEKIKKGEQLYDNYGFHYALDSKPKRQQALKKQYFFDCQCRACVEDWSTFSLIKDTETKTNRLMELYYNDLANANVEAVLPIEPILRQAVKDLENKIPCKRYCEMLELWKQSIFIRANIRRELTEA